MSDPITPDVDDVDDSPEETPEVDKAEDTFDADRAKAKITKANQEAANLRKRLKELEPLALKAKELEDANKSETEKLSEDRDGHKGRADKAEASLRKLTAAFDAAPDGASPAQIRQVAKRLTGDTDDELQADAEELFELVGAKGKPKVPVKPTEALKGGGDPDESPEETDPRKLAALIAQRS